MKLPMRASEQKTLALDLNTLAQRTSGVPDSTFRGLVESAYEELRRIAHHLLVKHQRDGARRGTMGVTVLVDDVVMELLKQRNTTNDRAHMLSLGTMLMVRLIRMHQRQRMALKRGGGRRGASLQDDQPVRRGDVQGGIEREVEHESLDRLCSAMEAMRAEYPEQAEALTLSVICGMPAPQACALMQISESTFRRHERFARAWLASRLSNDAEGR